MSLFSIEDDFTPEEDESSTSYTLLTQIKKVYDKTRIMAGVLGKIARAVLFIYLYIIII